MTIDPRAQLQMLAAAALAGLLLGVFCDLLAALRIFCGAYVPPPSMLPYYQKDLPLLGRPAGKGRVRPMGRLWRAGVVAAGDLCCCLAGAVAVELILYRFNRGSFRVAVPLLLLSCLALWRVSAAKLSARLTDGLALALTVGFCYVRALVLLPFLLTAKAARCFLFAPLARHCGMIFEKRAQKISDLLCSCQRDAAAAGFGCLDDVKNRERKKLYEKRSK